MVIRESGNSSPRLVYRKGVLVLANSSCISNGGINRRASTCSSPTTTSITEPINEGNSSSRRWRRESLTAAYGTSASGVNSQTYRGAPTPEDANKEQANTRRGSYVDGVSSSGSSVRRRSSGSSTTSQPYINSLHHSQHDQFTPATGQVTTTTTSTTSSATGSALQQQQQRRTSTLLGFQQRSSSQVETMANPGEESCSGGNQPVRKTSVPSNVNNNNNNNSHNKAKEFIPSFVLVDACKANNERKIRDLVRRLTPYSGDEVDPIVNFQDSCGRTALSYACSSGNVMIIDELSKLRRLDPNRGDNENNTPLHYAAQAGHSEAVDLLLSRFEGVIDPNCRNSTGLTPLMKAALQGRTRCAKSLISAGASANLRDYSRGLTAAEWARLCGRHICAEVIIRCAKDNYQDPFGSSPDFPRPHHHPQTRGLPVSQSALELKKLGSSEESASSPYYHLYATRNTISGASWLKNKIKKALGSSSSNLATAATTTTTSNNNYEGPRRESFALLANLTGPTICAGSLLLPSIKPLIDQQKPKLSRKLTIPVLQVTPVKR